MYLLRALLPEREALELWFSRSTVYENIPAGEFWGGFPARPRRQWLREVVALKRLAESNKSNNPDEPSDQA